MASKTDIANQALSRIGAKTIMDLDDTTSTSARVVKNVFEQSVREVGRFHDWNCLMERSNLAQLSTPPAFGWEYQYQLPTNCLKLCTVNGYEIGDNEDAYDVEGRKILTDSDECKITYVAYKEDTGEYDPLFVEALVVYIAAKIATSIRQDENLASQLKQEFYQYALPKARKKDGNEKRQRRIDIANDSDWIRSRVTSTTG
jgi:hypothetical protein